MKGKTNLKLIKTNLVKLAKIETVSAVKLLGVNTGQLLVRTLTSAEAHSEPTQILKMEVFGKIVNS